MVLINKQLRGRIDDDILVWCSPSSSRSFSAFLSVVIGASDLSLFVSRAPLFSSLADRANFSFNSIPHRKRLETNVRMIDTCLKSICHHYSDFSLNQFLSACHQRIVRERFLSSPIDNHLSLKHRTNEKTLHDRHSPTSGELSGKVNDLKSVLSVIIALISVSCLEVSCTC